MYQDDATDKLLETLVALGEMMTAAAFDFERGRLEEDRCPMIRRSIEEIKAELRGRMVAA